MRKLAIAAISALFSLAALGQDLLQCVNPDVLNSLLFHGRSETRMSVIRKLPDDMSGYRAPTGFELIGTAVRGDSGLTTVAFKTGLSVEEAFVALLASFATDGWTIENSQAPQQTFNVTGQPVTETICRNAERRSLSVREFDGVRYASVNSYPDPRALDCNEEDPRLALRGPGMFEAMRAKMPTFDFPSSTRAAGDEFGRGMGGSGETVSTSSRIESPDTAASLAEHLAAQMTAQGWRRDASWSGMLSSGSTWMRQGDDARPYWGTLEIVSLGDNVYAVSVILMGQPL